MCRTCTYRMTNSSRKNFAPDFSSTGIASKEQRNPNMTTNFYRFRSVTNLLGTRQELENQQIYFASPDQLNDPLEGHIDLYWQGDAIVWRNLFKNYLFCALYIFNLWSLDKDGRHLKWEDIPVENPLAAGQFSEHHELVSNFFGHQVVDEFLSRVINSKRRIGRNEITAIFRGIHNFVIFQIFEIYQKRNGSHDGVMSDKLSEAVRGEVDRIKSATCLFDIVEEVTKGNALEIERQYVSILNGYEEVDLLNYFENAIDLNDKSRVFIFNDFCRAYVRRLGSLMYPPWYAACFMEECTAASMWAYYGSDHSGVCLKFRASSNAAGASLNLNAIVGYNAEGSVRGMRPFDFKAVSYRTEHESVNFFETIGAVPVPIANSQWYTDGSGGISGFLLRTEDDREVWRKNYWSLFEKSSTTKTRAWEAEKEQRLVYYSSLADVSADDRTMQYDFSSLEGIIFGVRTPTSDMMKIIEIIKRKCQKNGRADFKFYRADFSPGQDRMTISELRVFSGDLLIR